MVGYRKAQRLELGDNLRLAGLVFSVRDQALLVKFLELAESLLDRIGAACTRHSGVQIGGSRPVEINSTGPGPLLLHLTDAVLLAPLLFKPLRLCVEA